MHRTLPLSPKHRLSAVLIAAAVSVMSGDALAVRVGGGSLGPLEHLDPFVPLVGGGYALCYGSCAEPYGIDDLRQYRSVLGARIGRIAVWARWDALAHDLYRLDEMRVRFGVEPFPLPLSIALEPILRREKVSGYPAGYATGLAAVLAAGKRRIACSLAGEIPEGGKACPVLLSCRAGLDRLSFTAAVSLRDGRVEFREVEGELSIEGIATLRTGYRLYTGEVLCGIGLRRRSILVTATWEHHPVLGGTLSLGVGCVWAR